MGTTEFNEQFFQDLLVSPQLEAVCVEAGQRILAEIQATGPEDTGEYLDGFVIRVKRQKRVVVEVVGTDPKTLLIEARLGVMAKALQRARRRG